MSCGTPTGGTGKPMSLASLDYKILQQCMHCGMCLPTCPTYEETRLERHSPRGRISLMRAVADGELSVTRELADEMYYCLGCLACESACPAGVQYAPMLETARAEIERLGVAGGGQRVFWRWFAVKTVFMHPRLLRAFGRSLRIYQASGMQSLFRRMGLVRLLPNGLRQLEPQTPVVAKKFSNELIAEVEYPSGEARHRVAVLTGCMQDLVFPDVNRSTADVLLANHCEVHTPPVQPCCGSLHSHNGEPELAQKLARQMIDLLPPGDFDAIITNAGGCGSHLKHYDRLLADDTEYAERAAEWSRKCRDIHEWLIETGMETPSATDESAPTKVAYHHSCHLCHGQKVRTQPTDLLGMVPGIELVPLAESDWCCGSAGIYSITQPEQASKLLDRKLGHLRESGAGVCAAANPGCHIQLENGIRSAEMSMKVVHPITLLADAYRKGKPSPDEKQV